MRNSKSGIAHFTIIAVVAGIIILASAAYFGARNYYPIIPDYPVPKQDSLNSPTWQTYRNEEYGFEISLPISWRGYKVGESQRDIYAFSGESSGNVAGHFPLIEIIHPLSTNGAPRQNVPVYIFTNEQWRHIYNEKDADWSVGAAPIPPSELGHNSKYVFALPARYNYADLNGREEVQQIIDGKSLTTFEPRGVDVSAPAPASTLPTLNKKIYRNAKYGFELKYPSDGYKLEENNSSMRAVSIYPIPQPKEFGPGFFVEVKPNNGHLVANDLLGYAEEISGDYFISAEKLSLGGESCVNNHYKDDYFESEVSRRYICIVNDSIFSIVYFPINASVSNELESIARSISFFLSPSVVGDISTWKTYRDVERGFEFKYPKELMLRASPGGNVTLATYTLGTPHVPTTNELLFRISIVQQPPMPPGMSPEKAFGLAPWFDSVEQIYNIEGVQEITFAGGPAVSVERQEYKDKTRERAVQTSIHFLRNGTRYELSYAPYDSEWKDVAEEIIATFRFVK